MRTTQKPSGRFSSMGTDPLCRAADCCVARGTGSASGSDRSWPEDG
jgi:hypothetical protein